MNSLLRLKEVFLPAIKPDWSSCIKDKITVLRPWQESWPRSWHPLVAKKWGSTIPGDVGPYLVWKTVQPRPVASSKECLWSVQRGGGSEEHRALGWHPKITLEQHSSWKSQLLIFLKRSPDRREKHPHVKTAGGSWATIKWTKPSPLPAERYDVLWLAVSVINARSPCTVQYREHPVLPYPRYWAIISLRFLRHSGHNPEVIFKVEEPYKWTMALDLQLTSHTAHAKLNS